MDVGIYVRYLSAPSRRRHSLFISNGVNSKARQQGVAIFFKFCWVRKHVSIIMKPTNSPTQGQPNPRKLRLKSGILGPFIPTATYFFVGWDWFYTWYRKKTTRNLTPPTTFSANTLILLILLILLIIHETSLSASGVFLSRCRTACVYTFTER